MPNKSAKNLRIAVIGHRGIPGNYGGFETFAEELCIRLARHGFDMTSYNRVYAGTKRRDAYKGVHIINIPSIKNKFFDTIGHSLLAALHAATRRYDAIVMVNVGNAPIAWIPRLVGTPVLLNVDGLEWERKKWGRIARMYLKFCAWLATWTATEIITDAKVIQDFYLDTYRKQSTMIPYGARIQRKKDRALEKKFGIKLGNYFLYVSRFEPENNPHLVVKAFEQTTTKKSLVMIGGSTYDPEFEQAIRATRDPRIKFLGFVYGKNYKSLQQNAYAYIQATEVGGTHPALIEAMGFGNCVLANDKPELREVANGSALFFKVSERNTRDLARKIDHLAHHPLLARSLRRKAIEHVRRQYTWKNSIGAYEDLILQTITARSGKLVNLSGERSHE